MNKPYFSIIIPTYNRVDSLTKTVDAVLKQSYQEFELIVVDDGSTDNTREVLGKLNDHRVKYFYQENQGPSSARN